VIRSDPPGPGVIECDRETTSAAGAWIYDGVDCRGRVAWSCGGRKLTAEGFGAKRSARGDN
jgi:hypothetical protein